jgi:hypothetical protein
VKKQRGLGESVEVDIVNFFCLDINSLLTVFEYWNVLATSFLVKKGFLLHLSTM